MPGDQANNSAASCHCSSVLQFLSSSFPLLRRLTLLTSLTFLTIFLAGCPKPPDEPDSVKADCLPGFLPCEDDSTICCEVICPPGYILGGPDSTECIAVVCPEYYHLCGPDSTDCCLETTSHSVTIEVDTLLYSDMHYLEYYAEAISFIDDTTVWVVGDFLILDTTGSMTHFERSFNLVEWDGVDWELKKIYNPDWSQSVGGLKSIFVINKNDIWVGGPFHFDGQNWQFYRAEDGWPLFGANINAIWASGPDDVFFVSNGGQINHWDGSGFERMDTPTDVPLLDIWGMRPNDVWIAGNNSLTAESVLLYYDGNTWSLKYHHQPGNFFWEDSLSGRAASVVAFPDSLVCVLSPQGIYTTTKYMVPGAQLAFNYWPAYPIRMRGNHVHDLFICGQNSLLAHYNGIDFVEYSIPVDLKILDLAVRENQIMAVGIQYGAGIGGAFVIRVKRR